MRSWAGIGGKVAKEGVADVEEYFCEAILTRQRGLLRFAASGLQGKF